MRPSTDSATATEKQDEVAAVTEYPGRDSNSYDPRGRGILSQPLGEQEAKPTHAVNPSLPSTDAAPVVRECPVSSGPVATDFATAPTGAAVAPGSRAVAELLAYLADAVNADECAPAHWDTAVGLAQAVGRLREDAERGGQAETIAGAAVELVSDARAQLRLVRGQRLTDALDVLARDHARLVILSELRCTIEPPHDDHREWTVTPADAVCGWAAPTLGEAIDLLLAEHGGWREWFGGVSTPIYPTTDHARAAGGDAGAGR